MLDKRTKEWIRLIEIMNSQDDTQEVIKDALEALCDSSGMGCDFVYTGDHLGIFSLADSYMRYAHGVLPATIDVGGVLGLEGVGALVSQKKVSFREGVQGGQLEEALGQVFSMRSLDLVPVLDQSADLIAIVGIGDRRGKVRGQTENEPFTYSLLTTLGNHVKIKLYQQRIENARRSFEGIMDNMGIDVYVNDFHTHEILYVNRSMADPYGGKEAIIGKPCWEVLYDDKPGQCEFCPQKKIIDENGNPTRIHSWDYQRPFDGSWFRVLSAAFRWQDGRLAHVVSSVDITENKKNENIIRRMAEYDHLTGLPNRHKLTLDCDSRFDAQHLPGSVIFFDLDGFKAVNDTLGHGAGDELLAKIGAKLQESPYTKDRCYRYGGDEFVVLCSEKMDEVVEALSYIRSLFAVPWQVEAGLVDCDTSIGVATYPEDGEKASELLRNADRAMYVSKNGGRGLIHFYKKGAMEPMNL